MKTDERNTPAARTRTSTTPQVCVRLGSASARSRRFFVTAAGAALLGTLPALATPPLIQLPGASGCIAETGLGGSCVDGVALDGASAAVVSPDGRNVYVVSAVSHAVVAFDRHHVTGALTPKLGVALCVSETGTGGTCVDGVALEAANGVAISPDGRQVYVSAATSNAVAVLDRDVATGALTPKGSPLACISESGTGGACGDGVALANPVGIVVSPDGRNVYVASNGSSAVAVFDRDGSSGTLTQKPTPFGCVSETGNGGACADGVALVGALGLAISPDGRNLYLASVSSAAVAIFDRHPENGRLTQKAGTAGCVSDNGTGGECVDGTALSFTRFVAVSADGRSVYASAANSGAIAVFDRDAESGALTQKAGTAGCVSETGTGGACADGVALDRPAAIEATPDGRSLYVASQDSDAVAVFDRDGSSGVLTQKPGPMRCISETGTSGACGDGAALDEPVGLAISLDGRSVYVPALTSDAIAVFTRDVPTDDIDGNGSVDPLTDGLLQLRYFFGFRGAALVAGAVDPVGCTRCTAAAIEAYIQALLAPG
jgi:DNA-binding beta-propeller fold protein YncE